MFFAVHFYQLLIELINGDKEVQDVITAIHLQDSFSFLCDICKLAQVKSTI